MHNITDTKAKEDKLEYMATHDALTGLPNRVLFEDRLTVALTQAEGKGTKLGVVVLDLDNFKAINDVLGHTVGDQLLKQIADRLRNRVRRSDTIARMGGDQFVILLSEMARQEHGRRVANRVLKAFQDPFVLGGLQFRITASMGFAIYPDHGEDAETLVKNAGTAMYRAKQNSKNSWRYYTSPTYARPLKQPVSNRDSQENAAAARPSSNSSVGSRRN